MRKKSQFFVCVVLLLVVLTAAMIVFVACDKSPITDETHQHTFSDKWSFDSKNHWHAATCGHEVNSETAAHTFDSWQVTKQATESEEGSQERTCSVCGYKQVEVIPMVEHVHTFSKDWTWSSAEHWHASTCGHDVVSDKAVHSFVDDVCEICQYKKEKDAHIVTFIADDKVVSAVSYFDGESSVEEPAVPQKVHYEGAWEKYELVGDVTVYALYTPIEYTVTFQGNGEVIKLHYNIENKGNFKAPEVPEKEHYIGAWSEFSLAFDNTQIVEAVYTPIEYTITFVCNNNKEISDLHYNIESSISLPDAGTKPYSQFLGWCREENLSDTPFKSLPKGTVGNMTLYAKWKGEDKHVVLNPNNGTVSNTSITIEYGTTFTIEVPLLEGSNFVGWFTESGTQLTDAQGKGLAAWNIGEDTTTLFAHWSHLSYTVHYVVNGGSDIADQQYEYGQKLKFPDNPTKANMKFAGWYLDNGFAERAEEGISVTSNLTLYAKWDQVVAIHNAEELKLVNSNPNQDYYLANDINLLGEQWSPLENFYGTFDGRNHRIYNFTMSVSLTAYDEIGFFVVNEGTITNLTLEAMVFNYTTTQESYAGGLVGINRGDIENCIISDSDFTVHGNFHESNAIMRYGGLCGLNEGKVVNSKMSDTRLTMVHECTSEKRTSSNSSCNAKAYVASVVGENSGAIEQCFSDAVISITQNSINQYDQPFWSSNFTPFSWVYAGGIVGYQKEQGSMLQCEFDSSLSVRTGTVEAVQNYENSGTYNFVGGLVGEAYGSISLCVARGSLTANANDQSYVGGLAGSVYGNVSNCYSQTDIDIGEEGKYQTSGGFVGINYGTIRNCYSGGRIVRVKTAANAFCGSNQGSGSIVGCIALTKLECSGSNVSKFVMENQGTLTRSYHADNIYGGGDYASDFTEERDVSKLQSYDFLVNELYWDEAQWSLDPTGAAVPKLAWEKTTV